jgi:hypothetical protein
MLGRVSEAHIESFHVRMRRQYEHIYTSIYHNCGRHLAERIRRSLANLLLLAVSYSDAPHA